MSSGPWPQVDAPAGRHGDGFVTDPMTWQQHKAEWEAGVRDAGKDPTQMPVLVEQYAVVGELSDAMQAAELWRFGPRAFKGYYNIVDPAEIEKRSEAEVPLDQITKSWPVGIDPRVHVAKIRELFDSRATIVNIHAGQMDQKRVIEFYGSYVLPKPGLPTSRRR